MASGETGTAASDGVHNAAQTIADSDADPVADPTTTLPLGELLKARLRKTGDGGRVGRYLILRLLGEGGMGAVFAAYDEELDRKIALKLLRSDRARGIDRDHFLREAKAMAKLSHPNIAHVYDVGEFDEAPAGGQLFIAMELVRGTNLRRHLREHRPDQAAIIDLFGQAGDGLVAVHTAGLIHRDFKPANVLVGEDGRVRVVDFGLAQGGNADAHTLKARAGTPAYMAREQHLNLNVDARSDQFAFAVALYEALYGQRPFAGKTIAELSKAVIADERRPPPPDVVVPSRIRRLLERALQADADERYPTMAALLDDLRPPPRHQRGLALVAVALAVALVIALALIARQRAADAALICASGERRIAEAWAPGRRDRAAAAFTATGLPYADETWSQLRERLDDYAELWATIDRESCEERRTGALTDNLYERASACLDAGRRSLGALATAFAEADPAVVDKALVASEALPPLERCRDRDALLAGLEPIEDGPRAVGIAAVRDELAAVIAKLETSHLERCDALTKITQTVNAIAYEPLEAELAFTEGRCDELAGDYQDSLRRYRQALTAALASGHDRMVLEVSLRISRVYGLYLGEVEEAMHWLDIADSLIQRTRGDDGERASSLLMRGAILTQGGGQRDKARGILEEARSQLRQSFGERHSTAAAVANNLAILDVQEGRTAAVTSNLEAARALSSEYLGADHPSAMAIAINLANAYLRVRDLDRAEALMRELLERKIALVGAEHPDVAILTFNLGSVYQRRSQIEGEAELLRHARNQMTRAVELRAAALGDDNPRTASARAALGGVLNDLGDYAAAREPLEQALAVYSAGDPENPRRAYALSRLGRTLSMLGEHEAALARFDEAQRIHTAVSTNPDEVADHNFWRGVAIDRASDDPSARRRARALVEEALAALDELGGFDYETKRARVWLREHPLR